MNVRQPCQMIAQFSRERRDDFEAIDDCIRVSPHNRFRPLASVRPDIERQNRSAGLLVDERRDERALSVAVEVEERFVKVTEQELFALARDVPDDARSPVLPRVSSDPKAHDNPSALPPEPGRQL